MGNFTETSQWVANINKKETTDAVLGGSDTAPANLGLGQVVDRTLYLKDQLEGAGVGETKAKIYSGNLNSLLTSGFFYINSSATNKPGATGTGFCFVIATSTAQAAQWYTDTGTGKIYHRTITTGPVISSWDLLAFDDGTGSSLTFLQNVIKSMLNPSNDLGVIVSGCTVSNVNTGASTLEISAGVCLVGTTFVQPVIYTGGYPVYLPESGVYTVVEPASGNYITFDPYTSQRYPDVLRRSQAYVGEIRTFVVDITTDLDGTGLGKWKYFGWALANGQNGTVDLGARAIVAYKSGDSDFGTIAGTTGSKTHTLTEAELPQHNHGVQGAYMKKEGTDNTEVHVVSTGSDGDATGTPSVDNSFVQNAGSGQAHNIIQPSIAVVMLQRI